MFLNIFNKREVKVGEDSFNAIKAQQEELHQKEKEQVEENYIDGEYDEEVELVEDVIEESKVVLMQNDLELIISALNGHQEVVSSIQEELDSKDKVIQDNVDYIGELEKNLKELEKTVTDITEQCDELKVQNETLSKLSTNLKLEKQQNDIDNTKKQTKYGQNVVVGPLFLSNLEERLGRLEKGLSNEN